MNTEENPLVRVIRLETNSNRVDCRRGSRFSKRICILHVLSKNKDVGINISDIFRLNFPNGTPPVDDLFKAMEETKPSEVCLRFMPHSGSERICSDYLTSWIERVHLELAKKGIPSYRRKKQFAYSGEF